MGSSDRQGGHIVSQPVSQCPAALICSARYSGPLPLSAASSRLPASHVALLHPIDCPLQLADQKQVSTQQPTGLQLEKRRGARSLKRVRPAEFRLDPSSLARVHTMSPSRYTSLTAAAQHTDKRDTVTVHHQSTAYLR